MAELELAALSDIPAEPGYRWCLAGTMAVLLVREEGCRVRAFDGICPHRGAALVQGTIESGRLICPWHGWEFQVSDGACLTNPHACLKEYAVRLEGERVLVMLPE